MFDVYICFFSFFYRAQFAVLHFFAFASIVRPELFYYSSSLDAALFCCLFVSRLGATSPLAAEAQRALRALHWIDPPRVIKHTLLGFRV